MTVNTREALAGVVVRVTEGVAIRASIGTRWSICLLIVADAARRDLATRVRFTRRCVACVAIIVSGDICRDRQSRAALERRIVTTRTAPLRARCSSVVLSVIKLDVERFVEAGREILQRRIATADVGVTNHAHRDLRRRELSAMTVSTRFVTRKARRR